MLVSETLTIGQISFIFRVLIQVLAYGGLFLFSRIILSTVPRVATLPTHDLINRLVGGLTATTSSLSWILRCLTGRSGDRSFPSGLIASVLLFTVYSSLVTLSDVGFLGIYSCTAALPPYIDSPLSVHDAISANASIAAALVNGTDPSLVKAYRCDSFEFHQFNANVSEYVCTSWHNGTYGDASFFQNLNTTDSAILMNRQLSSPPLDISDFYLNSWYNGPGSARVEEAIVSNGILIQPDTTGFRAIVGVPPLPPQSSMQLDNVMAIEADMGCISLGLFTERDLDGGALTTFDIFATNWTQLYHGPDNMKDTLVKWGARIRSLVRPLFNESSINDVGYLFANGLDNGTGTPLGYNMPTADAKVVGWSLPGNLSQLADQNFTAPIQVTVQMALLNNCTQDLYSALGVTLLPNHTDLRTPGSACANLAVQGSFTISSGLPLTGFSRFLCAASTQVNLVSANISSSNDSTLTLNFLRNDADLHYTVASWWHLQPVGNDTAWLNYEPYERYTLTPSPGSGRLHHYLPSWNAYSLERLQGPGSAGGVISVISSYLLTYPDSYQADSTGLANLDDDESFINFNATMIPTWAGGMGAAFLREGVTYNGWAALDRWHSGGVLVLSGGEKPAVCYTLRYGIAFLPLLIAAVITLLWGAIVLARSRFKGRNVVQALYGGLSPLRAMLVPVWAAKSTVLIWQGVPEPHLEKRADRKYVLMTEKDLGGTAASYLRHHDAPMVDFVEVEHGVLSSGF
ncbi:hypothetical protein C8F04DRAFT_1111922 [Mycena alexandri]|uniref:Uncharacterized protein n=1 Tax=Mycena alexandri TaxID=1745969 RepID=A0AAD6WXE3_9AGAR|nr:hypothetical protein C8F04DRAFT_1111922 [Mycena alexandri]